MRRREFLKGLAASSIGASVWAPLYSYANNDDMVIKGPPVPDVPATQVSDKCFYVRAKDAEPTPENQGFFSNPGFILTSEGVVVIDTGGSVQISEMILRQIRKVTHKPVIAVINTHYHGDHWLGNHAWVAENPKVDIYAHPAVFEQYKNGAGDFWIGFMQRNTDNAISGTIATPPNQQLKGGETLKFGDTVLKIQHYENADYGNKVHTEADLIVEVPDQKVVFIGDVAMRRVANAADGSFRGTIEAMQQWQKQFTDYTLVPGHGFHDGIALFQDQERFFKTIWDNVVKYYDEGLSDFEMKPKIMAESFMQQVASKWPGYRHTIGKFISVAVQEYENSQF